MAEGDGIILSAERLTKRYGDVLAVDGLEFEVRRGEIFGLLGPNGAGKTTTIGMICGLIRPDAGRVLVAGRPAGSPDVARTIGLAPQDSVLWPRLTCLEQLVFVGEMYGVPPSEARRRGVALLDAVGLVGKSDRLARTLSGGMRRRLNLILAMVHDPDILVLDEPEAGLDPQSRVLVREMIRSLARSRGKTVILTTHDMDEADRLADRVAIIDHGRVLVADTPEALKNRVGRARAHENTLEDAFIALTGRSLRE